MKFLELIPPID